MRRDLSFQYERLVGRTIAVNVLDCDKVASALGDRRHVGDIRDDAARFRTVASMPIRD